MRRAVVLTLLGALISIVLVDWKTSVPALEQCRGYKHEYQRATDHNDSNQCATLRSIYFTGHRPIALWAIDSAIDYPEAITGIATLLLVFVTGGLVWIAKDQSKTARAQLRAYVGIAAARLENTGLGQIPVAVINIKNFGHTPAYQMTQWARLGFAKYPSPDIGPVSDQKILAEGTMQPGGEMRITPSGLKGGHAITAAHLKALHAGTHAIYVEGMVTYIDAFGARRESVYLLFSGGDIGFGADLAAFRSGNYST
jgi:hypothetical protein